MKSSAADLMWDSAGSGAIVSGDLATAAALLSRAIASLEPDEEDYGEPVSFTISEYFTGWLIEARDGYGITWYLKRT